MTALDDRLGMGLEQVIEVKINLEYGQFHPVSSRFTSFYIVFQAFILVFGCLEPSREAFWLRFSSWQPPNEQRGLVELATSKYGADATKTGLEV